MMDAQNPFYKSANGYFPMFEDLLADTMKSVTKTADDTVVFELKHPFAPLLSTLTVQSFSIVSKEYADALQKAGKPGDLDSNPIGTGPFQLVQYQKDAVIRFRAFPDFWGAKTDAGAKVDNLIFSITPDPSVRFAKLRANECQIARYPNPADLPAMRKNPDLTVQDATIAALDYIRFKTDKAPLNDKRVRLALAQAIDLDDLVKAVYQGSGTPTAAMVPPALWGHDGQVQPYPYDPAAAKKLLAEAGYPNGFKLDLWAIPVVRAYMPNGRRAAEMIQADWAKIGVQANIVTYEWGEYLKRNRQGEGDVVMLGGTWDYPDPSEIMLGFTCDAIKTGGNSAHWCNQAYTDAVNKANLVTDLKQRGDLYVTAQEAVHDGRAADAVRRREGLGRAAQERAGLQAALPRRPAFRRRERRAVGRDAARTRHLAGGGGVSPLLARHRRADRLDRAARAERADRHRPSRRRVRRQGARRQDRLHGGADARLRHVAAPSRLRRLGDAAALDHDRDGRRHRDTRWPATASSASSSSTGMAATSRR